MKSALFVNFTEEDFTGFWDGRAKKIAAGESMYMPNYLARHFAKHLANRELLRKDDKGKSLYPNGDKFTSPKRPGDVPQFMSLFNQAYKPDEEEDVGEESDDIDELIDVANKNRKKATKKKAKPKSKSKASPKKKSPAPKISSDLLESEEDEFEGKPTE